MLLAVEQLHVNVRPRDALDALADVFALAGLECQDELPLCRAQHGLEIVREVVLEKGAVEPYLPACPGLRLESGFSWARLGETHLLGFRYHAGHGAAAGIGHGGARRCLGLLVLVFLILVVFVLVLDLRFHEEKNRPNDRQEERHARYQQRVGFPERSHAQAGHHAPKRDGHQQAQPPR